MTIYFTGGPHKDLDRFYLSQFYRATAKRTIGMNSNTNVLFRQTLTFVKKFITKILLALICATMILNIFVEKRGNLKSTFIFVLIDVEREMSVNFVFHKFFQ